MKVAIVGSGYVGLVTGTCFAEVGIEVMCVDVDTKKIENLKNGIIPIYEPGLEDMVHRNMKKGRLQFTTNISEALEDACSIDRNGPTSLPLGLITPIVAATSSSQ